MKKDKEDIGFRLSDMADVLPAGQAGVVRNCPVSRRSQGVITMTPALVAQIAGAARDKIEWIAFLSGTRSEDGFEVAVDHFTVPQQYRGQAHADIPETAVTPDVVGVMHLHPWWSQASFSGTDDNSLNPRYSSSIVVSPARNNIGFTYEACGKVILPCGAMGEEVPFKLQVAGAERFAQQIVRAAHEGEVPSLGDCANYSETEGDYTTEEHAVCGLSSVVDTPLVFGIEGGQDFLAVVQRQTLQRPASTYFTNSHKGLLGDGKGNGGSNGGSSKGKKNRKGKFSARKSGFQRMERPGEREVVTSPFYDRSTGRNEFIWKMCGSCRFEGLTKKHEEFDDFLCANCWEEAEQIIEDSMAIANKDESALDRIGSLLIQMDEGDVVLTDSDLEGTELGAGSENTYLRITD